MPRASDKQRQVLEIAIQAPQSPPGDDAIKVRHILYAPKDDPSGAADLPADDPAWTAAQVAATAAYEELKADPTKFDAKARKDSDEASALGETGSGGKLPYFDTASIETGLDPDFAAAILKPDLKAGQLLEPVKSAFGWHVIQVMYRPPDADEMKLLRDQAVGGKDFAALARDYSEGPEAGEGGDKGWVAQGLIDARLLKAIFDTPVGEVTPDRRDQGRAASSCTRSSRNGPRRPTRISSRRSRRGAFQNWYGEKKDAVTITRELLTDLQAS